MGYFTRWHAVIRFRSKRVPPGTACWVTSIPNTLFSGQNAHLLNDRKPIPKLRWTVEFPRPYIPIGIHVSQDDHDYYVYNDLLAWDVERPEESM